MLRLVREQGLEGALADIAEAMLSMENEDSVADEVALAFSDLSVNELFAMSGPTRDGYVDPQDLAWEWLSEAFEPFLETLDGLLRLREIDLAVEYAHGMVLGLYRTRDVAGTVDTVAGNAPDWHEDAAAEALLRLPRDLRDHGEEFGERIPEWRTLGPRLADLNPPVDARRR